MLSLPSALTLQCLPPPDPAGPWEVLSPRLLPVLGVQRVPGRGALHSGRGEQHLLCQRLSHVSPGAVGQVTPAVSPASPGSVFPPCLSGFSIPGLSTSSLPISRSSVAGAGPGSLSGTLSWMIQRQSSLSSPCLLPARSVLVGGGGDTPLPGAGHLPGVGAWSLCRVLSLAGWHPREQPVLSPSCGSRPGPLSSGPVRLPRVGLVPCIEHEYSVYSWALWGSQLGEPPPRTIRGEGKENPKPSQRS